MVDHNATTIHLRWKESGGVLWHTITGLLPRPDSFALKHKGSQILLYKRTRAKG
jgi:hypothetical protein